MKNRMELIEKILVLGLISGILALGMTDKLKWFALCFIVSLILAGLVRLTPWLIGLMRKLTIKNRGLFLFGIAGVVYTIGFAAVTFVVPRVELSVITAVCLVITAVLFSRGLSMKRNGKTK